PSILNSMKPAQIVALVCCGISASAAVDVRDLQTRLGNGKAEEVRALLSRAVNNDPKNPYLLYDRAIALYAVGKYDDALVDLDLVEDSQRKDLVQKARF